MNIKRYSVALFFLISLTIAVFLAPGLVQASPSPLPPRPTPPAPGQPDGDDKPAAMGAMIELQVQLEGVSSPWQQLWTIVQWQDHQGYWHTVDGWQGTLDKIWGSEGSKSWWVSSFDLDTGPFRWIVRENAQGGLLGASEPFSLPGSRGHLVVNLSLMP